jgi:hypothetical protein
MKSAQAIAGAMGIAAQNTVVLRDGDATKAGILAALRALAERTADGARTFLYYSGHGTRWQDPQSGACVEGLLTHDFQVITHQEIAAVTKRLSDKADKFISLFDACFSGGVAPTLTRSLAARNFKPKFFAKGGADACKATNLMTRSLLGEATRLGALPENMVQITSSLQTEVSYDIPGQGGVATLGMRACLLGQAKDTDGSGAITMREVEQCAQAEVNKLLGGSMQHVTVSGSRNLIPVSRPPAPAAPIAAAETKPAVSAPVAAPASPPTPAPAPASAPTPAPSPATTPTPAPAPAPAPTPAPSPATTPTPAPAPVAVAVAAAPVTPAPSPAPAVQAPKPPASAPLAPVSAKPPEPPKPAPEVAKPEPVKVEPAMASLATLKDILQQANPRRQVKVSLSKPALRIGKDSLDITVTSKHAGYVYMVMLGSDAQSFYILFPNGLDGNNAIEANKPLRLPRPDWQVQAAGPAGTDQLLVMVSDVPRKLDGLEIAAPSTAAPFTYALNSLPGRAALINFLTGSGVTQGSESFGAVLTSLKEVK